MKKRSMTAITLCSALMVSSAFAASGAAWDYNDANHTGPTYWGDLSTDYHTCKDGFEQSPIDISTSSDKEIGELKFKYKKTPLEIVNNGHTIQVNYAAGSKLKIDDNKYTLLQFHFHTPSEHMVNGAASPMEVHFVHVNKNGQLAVVGVMMDYGKKNKTLGKILHNAPSEIATVTIDGKRVNGLALMPEGEDESEDFFNYAGSLTTPPCSEGVRWFVLKDRITVSHEQVEEFSHFVHGANARPVQPLNDRTVFLNDD